MEAEAKAFVKVWSIIILSICYCYFIPSKIRTGSLRLISLLPIIILFTLLPLYLSSTLPCGITAFFITWLGNFKLILYAYGQGPLPGLRSLSKFIIFAAFPIKKRTPHEKMHKKVVPLSFWSEGLIFSVLVAVCDIYKGKLPHRVVLVIYCCMLYLFIDVILGTCVKLVGSLLGVELSPPSDEPYVATSLQDFWGRRWNLMVTDALRHTVYKPVRGVLSKYVNAQSDLATVVGVTTSFLVSGLMHELIYYYMTRVKPTWEVTWFFVLQGLCVALESFVRKNLGPKLKLHWAVTGPLTVGFVIVTGFRWFFPQLVRNQVDLKAIEEAKTLLELIKGIFR